MEQQEDNLLPESRRLKQIRIIEAVNVYGLFFCSGVAAANISRLLPYGSAIYAAVLISVIGLSLLKAEVDAQKVIFLGISISAIAWWDALIQDRSVSSQARTSGRARARNKG